ncbi:hypothetical protein A3B56_03480 [Candidatus Roizmanbacteria bacterium RIFCSPLOWO2_01_FULL_45_11]|uniref:Uncharacterized protein n=1 Tax=Candidatus Roizmanbacteria bacterium RIFCSPLOWO2_01_FULL_45_11 TaxID=1802070 RepID=A0A1F7JF60_9BACT|nr:MAG: hypothetical protein A3B56_03480 [Candidatus Roizmanbacteria bacterium RIFCSPLOWO2_01_FULL_45_11]
MRIRTNELVKVLTVYDPDQGRTIPHRIKWQNTVHTIRTISYYHRERRGQSIFHIYHVNDGTCDFRILCDSESLSWKLEEVIDGID